MTVFHNCDLHLRRRGHCPPLDSRCITLHWTGPVKPHRPAAIPPDQIIRTAPTRPLAIHSSNPQFLLILHDRSSLRTTQLRHSSPGSVGTSALRRLESRSGATEPSLPAHSSLGRLLVYRCVRGDCDDPSRVWLGCVGYVDAGGCVVCVVAGLVDRMCPARIIDVLIPCIHSNLHYLLYFRSHINLQITGQCKNHPIHSL